MMRRLKGNHDMLIYMPPAVTVMHNQGVTSLCTQRGAHDVEHTTHVKASIGDIIT